MDTGRVRSGTQALVAAIGEGKQGNIIRLLKWSFLFSSNWCLEKLNL
jgi:hypothetical protein